MTNIVYNQTATTNPGAANDSSQGYQQGALWFNHTNGILFECHDATVNAAVWYPVGTGTDVWPSQTTRGPDNLVSASNSTHSASVDGCCLLPIKIERKVPIDQLAMFIQALGAGSLFRLGIYDSDIDIGLPRHPVYNAGTIDGSTGGAGSSGGTRTLGLTGFLYPGLWFTFAAFQATGTPASVGRVSGSNGKHIHGPAMGDYATSPSFYRYYTISGYTFASGMPDNPTVTTSAGTDGIIVKVRRA